MQALGLLYSCLTLYFFYHTGLMRMNARRQASLSSCRMGLLHALFSAVQLTKPALVLHSKAVASRSLPPSVLDSLYPQQVFADICTRSALGIPLVG